MIGTLHSYLLLSTKKIKIKSQKKSFHNPQNLIPTNISSVKENESLIFFFLPIPLNTKYKILELLSDYE